MVVLDVAEGGAVSGVGTRVVEAEAFSFVYVVFVFVFGFV